MPKRLLTIHSLDAFHLVAILKTAKPRSKQLRESVLPLHDSLTAILADISPKEAIREAVVDAILETVHFNPPVSDKQTLDAMGYTDPTYAQLAAKMTVIVQHFKPTVTITRKEVITAETVGGCVELATTKAGV